MVKPKPYNKYPKKPTKRQLQSDRKKAAPFLLTEDDPTNFWGDDMPKASPRKVKPKRKPKKVLTNLNVFAKLKPISKANRKGDKMATDNKQPKTESNRSGAIKSLAWLLLAGQQAFAGYVLLVNFSNYFVIATAGISLGLAGVIVVAHFIKAHK